MRNSVRLLSAFLGMAMLAGLAACGGGRSSTTTNLTIEIVAANNTTALGVQQTVQFTATVSGAVNNAVTWEVDATAGGNSTVGTIVASGTNNNIATYTAPTTVPSPDVVTITAVSQQVTTVVSNSVSIQITGAGQTGVVVSPPSAVIAAGGTQTYSVTLNGASSTANWAISCGAAQPSACGSLNVNSGASVVYSAPPSPPMGKSVTITATTTSNGAGTATATIEFSGASFNGQYAFSFAGEDGNGKPLKVAGSFTTVGTTSSGFVNVSGGLLDLNSGTLGVKPGLTITGGSFSIGAQDGRSSGSLTAVAGGVPFQLNMQFTLISSQHAVMADFDSDVDGAHDTGSGTIDLQQTSQATPSNFSVQEIQGNYVFGLAGTDLTINPGAVLNIAGKFFADGSGGIPGATQQAVQDFNDGGTANEDTTLSGSYGLSGVDATTGRGILTLQSTLGTTNFAFYIVDATHLKVVEIDPAQPYILDGDVLSAPRTAVGAYTDAALTAGNYAFTSGNSTAAQPGVIGGVFVSGGNGSVTGGVVDVNAASQTSNNLSASAYTVDKNLGRIALTLTGGGTFQFAVYATAQGSLEMVSLDAGVSGGGLGYLQGSSTSAPSAGLGLNLTATTAGKSFLIQQDLVGELAAAGGTFNGNVDVNDVLSGTTPGAFEITNGKIASPGNFGRGLLSFQTIPSTPGSFSLIYYLVANPNFPGNPAALLLDSDAGRAGIGALAEQF
jgi:hypothetical protein